MEQEALEEPWKPEPVSRLKKTLSNVWKAWKQPAEKHTADVGVRGRETT